jgi:hypothetical protein
MDGTFKMVPTTFKQTIQFMEEMKTHESYLLYFIIDFTSDEYNIDLQPQQTLK